ncbi:uncharacterized protein LOC135214834 isoform X13 [Macrobrachium nipponense]|uniref:uncharacterized protein LOC135214834 isoform X13 n=1 Tax=Macrobrachium nipponense TaxID=159736 RepID=UPI0030C7ED4A
MVAMAKAKEKEAAGRANPTRKNNLNNNNNNDRNKKNLENGLYVHSSPPKAINSNNGQGSATIRDYIRAGDIEALEEVVLQGQGTKLVNQHATDQKVRNFLKTVPSYMSKIDLIHDAVEKGNLRDLKALLDRRKLARSKDAQGVGLLHKAVVHDHRGIVDYLISDYPETLDVTDHEGRTPLHYCAASNFADDMYSTLSDAVADPQLEDNNGKTAADYMSNPRELNISKKNNKKGSGDSKGKRMTPPKRKSPAHKIRTPPKREGMTITGANIRIWIHDKDLTQLEKIVWEGQGHRLLGETSNNAKVRQFLNLVPRMMTKIKEVHQAAINGDLETLDAKADPTDILIAKDQNGLTPLHKSAALGLKDVSEWIVQKNHSTLFAQDNKGRTPLFYAGIAKDGGEVYDMLLRSGADKNHNDQYRRTADHYRFKPTDLDVSIIHETPVAPRGGGGSTLDIPSRSSGSKEGSRAPSRNGKSRNPSRRNSPGEDKKKHDKKNDKEIPKGVQDFKDMKSVSDDEIEAFIREGDLESLEYVILSGRGTDLQGKSSWNDETRRFLKRVPGYMEKITALHEAAASGNVTNVRRLVKENQKLVMARDKDGAVALHHAAKSGDPKVTKYVMSLYPEAVTLEDNDGRTPLHYAGMARGAGADEVFSLLEKEGARPDEADLSGNTPEDYRQSSSRSNLLTVDNHERGRTKTREGKKGKSNGPSRDPSKGPSKGPSRDPSKGPSRDPSKGPSKDPAKGPSKGPSKAPSREPSKSREKSKEPSKQNSKQASKQNSKQPSKQNSKQPSRQNSRQPSKERGSEPSKADKSKDPSRSNSKAPSRRGSRGSSPHAVVGGAKNNIEIIAAIAAAEKNDDYKPLNDIVIRGDGEKLIGQTSKDPEVNDYLKKIPESLDAIEELHSAVEAGETRKVMQLLDKKQKAQTRDGNHANILHKAVLHGHTDLVRYIISSFPELAKQEDLAGRTPLHYAAVLRDGGHIYKILEKEGGNPKAKDKSGHSPEEYKNDPKILTQWDLMKELEDGIGNSDAKGRPDTKESEAPDGEDGSEQLDATASFLLEEEYKNFSNTESSSLLKRHLTPEIFDAIKDRTTALGATFYDCIKSGFANPDSHIGLYAPDAESYACFKELFDPVIDEYHGGFGPDDTHPTVDFGDPTTLGDLNAWGDYVVSTRVRCARSVEGYPFNPLLTSEQYTDLEQNVSNVLQTLEEDLAGNYRPISEISPEDQEELLEKHLLFKQGDRFLEAAGACRFWPEGRGIFLNGDNTLVIWVNEEDHLRIISMQEGGNLSEVYSRFVRAVTTLGEKLPFSSSEHLGFLSFCPTNLGTGIRASVHIRLPKLGEDMQTLEETANKYNLQVRGTSGEHSEAKGHVYDVSNRRRLGITEIEAIQEMYDGVKEIIQLEKSMEDGSNENNEEEGSEQDPAATISLDEEYEKFSNTESSSLLKKHLTPEIFDAIKDRTTSLGATLYDCIKSGFANPDSHIGLYAPDAESYACFKELFDPVIDEYHGGFGPDVTHPTVDFGDPTTLGDLNAWGDYVVSTRVRCARSVEGYPFNPLLTSEQYTDLEQNVSNALQTLEEDLAGNYRPISEISPEDQEELLEKHLLFKQGDRFLEAAGACRFWPEGRGIFLNGDNTLVIWVNEEDHMRIISMQEGGNLSEVYSRFVRAVTTLGEKLPFSSSEHLGFLSFCPTNLGTGIRASVHIRLPKLGEDMQTLEETANKYNLQVRGTSGEHSEAKGHVYDVSNRRRLGITEIEAIQEMYDGVKEIIQLEKSMEDSSNENTSNDTKADANLLSDRHKGMLSRRNSTISSKSEFPGMWSDEGQYLTKVLGDALVNALSEVNEARPKDPISYLACSLYNYRYSEKPDSPTNDSKSIGSTGSGGSGHSTIAMQTALDSTGGQQQTSPQTRDKNGQNVLHFAASRPHGRSAFYRLVAESGCNLADRDDQYRTPRDVAEDSDLQENVRAIDKWIINLAAEGKQKQLKKLLIDGYDHIADVDDDQGNNILNVAQNKGQGKTVDFLRGLAAFEEKRDWLHKAIRVGSLPHVQYIADSEDIARAKDVHSRTSLHIATLCEEKEIMEFLATQYPDLLKIGDNLERTPLHYAMAVEGVDQVAKVLVQAGARRAVKDLRGRTPSGSFIHPEIVRELQKEERKLTDPNIKPIPEEEPGVPEEEPGVPEEEPSVPEEEPGVPEEESGVPEEEKPVVPEEEPVVPEGDPGVPEEPVVA